MIPYLRSAFISQIIFVQMQIYLFVYYVFLGNTYYLTAINLATLSNNLETYLRGRS